MNSSSILSNAVSGMHASSSQLQATANNIVKAGLSNYKEVQVKDNVTKTNAILDNLRNTKDISPKLVNELDFILKSTHTKYRCDLNTNFDRI